MHELNAEQRKILFHIVVSLFNNKKTPTKRVVEFLVDYVLRLSKDPIPAAYLPFIALINPHLANLRALASGKKTKQGMVTVDVSLFDNKWKELPSKLNLWDAETIIAYPGDEITRKFLYFTDRMVFRVGTQEEKMEILNSMLERMATRPLIPNAITDATAWVHDLGTKLSTKGSEKMSVKGATLDETTIREQAFSAMRKNFGETFKLYSDDLRPLLTLYDTNKLKRDAFNPARFLKNQYPVPITAGNISTSIDGNYVPHGVVVVDNSKNPFGIWVWLSVTVPGLKADYAKYIAEFSSDTFDVPQLGPEGAQYFNVKSDIPTAEGEIKITVKPRK